MQGGAIRGGPGSPIALESTLGWILSGPVAQCQDISATHANFVQSHVLNVMQDKTSIEEQVSKFCTLESFGILKNELSFNKDFEEEIEFSEGRYQVKLPWKKDHPTLPNNFKLCQKRLIGLFSKLKKNRKLLNDYDSIINDQEERGIIKRVDSHFVGGVGKTHYIPHHPVIREDKETTKVLFVYDASAKDKTGVSLNQCLYPGPCLLKTIAEIIARFHLNSIALMSDIEKAFHMVSVHPSDRDI